MEVNMKKYSATKLFDDLFHLIPNIKTQEDKAKILGITQSAYSQLSENAIKKHIRKLYNAIKKIGAEEEKKRIIGCIARTQKFDSCVIQSLIDSKMSMKKIKNLFEKHATEIFTPIVEFQPCTPKYSGKTWSLGKIDSEISENLKDVNGVYAMYDSSGRILYFGKTEKKSGLLKEISQRMNASVCRTVYLQDNSGNLAKRRSVKIGEMTKYFTAYKISENSVIGNLEAMILHLIPNDDANSRLENLKKHRSKK